MVNIKQLLLQDAFIEEKPAKTTDNYTTNEERNL